MLVLMFKYLILKGREEMVRTYLPTKEEVWLHDLNVSQLAHPASEASGRSAHHKFGLPVSFLRVGMELFSQRSTHYR